MCFQLLGPSSLSQNYLKARFGQIKLNPEEFLFFLPLLQWLERKGMSFKSFICIIKCFCSRVYEALEKSLWTFTSCITTLHQAHRPNSCPISQYVKTYFICIKRKPKKKIKVNEKKDSDAETPPDSPDVVCYICIL